MTRMERLYLTEREGRRKWRVRRMIVTGVAALTLAMGGAALAAVDEGPGRGNPDTVQDGNHCPPGQNQDTSIGGLKKCP